MKFKIVSIEECSEWGGFKGQFYVTAKSYSVYQNKSIEDCVFKFHTSSPEAYPINSEITIVIP